MNSNYGKGSPSLNNFNFDFGIGSNRPRSLNDQKNQTFSSYSSYSSSTTAQPNKPSWTHQPAPSPPDRSGLNGPTSMVGDIFGKSWGSSTGSGSGSGIGIVEKNPNLFVDLVSSALGQGSKGSNSNAPLKDSKPGMAGSKSNVYSMGNIADSLPRRVNLAQSGGIRGSTNSSGSYSGGYYNGGSFNTSGGNVNVNSSTGTSSSNSSSKSLNLGGPSMKSMGGGGGIGGGMSTNRDPFGSLVDFGSKPKPGGINSGSKGSQAKTGDDGFGDFQNASRSGTTGFSSRGAGGFSNDFMGFSAGSSSNVDGFSMPGAGFTSQKLQPPVQSSGGDQLGGLFSSSSGGAATASSGGGGQQFGEVDDWGLDSEFGEGGNDEAGTTTELEGLPPPPAGVTASAAKNKGMDNQKQGQYADAIKWLSWAVVLLEKAGDKSSTMEAFSCRASCYKEVGEYKKAVADCTKVLEHDGANLSVLVQRALLYESMEKYRLGAEDLRTVLKIDPANRVARSTIHRLTKMVD